MSACYKPLPSALTRHESLTPTERAYFVNFNHEELTNSQWRDLTVLLEAVLASRVEGFNLHYTQRHESAMTAARGLCAKLLGPHGIAEPHRTLGFDWLTKPREPTALLAFYFRLREVQRQQELTAAKNRLISQLDLTPTQP